MKKVSITRIEDGKREHTEDHVTKGVMLKVVINSEEIHLFFCSRDYVNEMITGYLYTKGYITTTGDIRTLDYHMESLPDGRRAYPPIDGSTKSRQDGPPG